MTIKMSANEARVIVCRIEQEITTPEQYAHPVRLEERVAQIETEMAELKALLTRHGLT